MNASRQNKRPCTTWQPGRHWALWAAGGGHGQSGGTVPYAVRALMSVCTPPGTRYGRRAAPSEVFRSEKDSKPDRRWSSAGQRRTSPGMLLRVAGCSRYTTQLLSQPHTALLTQISTHAVPSASCTGLGITSMHYIYICIYLLVVVGTRYSPWLLLRPRAEGYPGSSERWA